MDFINGESLLALCAKENKKISEVMLEREIALGETTKEAVYKKLAYSISIMKNATTNPIKSPQKSIGGLLGGEAKAIHDDALKPNAMPLCGGILSKAIAYAMAVLEVNASMGLIVAAPTAGSAGVIPGAVLAVCEDYELGEDAIYSALLNASALGYIVMRNASVSGAEAGCQAEVGAASAMAASAIVELLGGTPEQSLHAASIAFSNLLGLVCDPIAGLVESPCQSRNAIGVSNAFTSAQIALAGVKHPIPFDEMVEAMYKVGLSLPFELRETALGGCAATPTGCELCKKCIG
ncbi:MAG: L-serine ammonia-lyase, iron-sulfur-dependent, subunit alpha [Firmicutes bacterium]|nr:L-serine ammonia-lyase, iron-sulfur-dependent, subunit alpha [Bacillota bacterium]